MSPPPPTLPSFNDARLVLLGPWGRASSLAALAVATLALGLTIWAYRAEPAGRRTLLVGLRLAAIFCALILFFQPARELRHLLSRPNHVAVLVDGSASMGVAEEADGETRAARAAALIRASRGDFTRWREEHVVDFYTFGSSLRPASEEALGAPASTASPGSQPVRDDRATELREALTDLRSRYDGHDLAGVVVVSDGIDNGRLAAEGASAQTHDFLASLDAPVHTAWVARSGLRDVAIERVDAPDFAFVHTVTKLRVAVRVVGYGAQDLPVTLRQNGQILRVQTIHVEPTDAEAPAAEVELELTPDRVGKQIYDLSLPTLPGEAVTANNRREIVLRVLRDKVRVLQVAGRPSPDERFLRALLKRDPNVDLISFFILRTPANLELVSQGELSLIPFPTDELFGHQLPSFDLVILQNFNYGPYNMGQYLGAVHDYVEGGGGLAMIGGDLSFADGDYAGTPVADVLPVRIPAGAGGASGLPSFFPDPGDPGAPPVAPQAPALVSPDDFHLQLTDAGERSPLTALRLDRAANDALWGSLPPLAGCNLLAGARPGAIVLGVHPTLKGDDGQPMPVLAITDAGKGRSLALASDSSWSWGFDGSGAQGARIYQVFWENAIRWLIHDPDFDLLRVAADASEYDPGATVRLSARLLDASYHPAAQQAITLTVARAEPDDARLVATRALTSDESGHATFELIPPAAGAYRVTAHATIAGRDVSAEEVFLVRGLGKELARIAGREDLLRLVATGTGGSYLSEPGELSSLHFAPPEVIAVDRKRDVELWSHPLVFFLAIGFLAAEWILRRRHGYV